jgi:hypothetical protein
MSLWTMESVAADVRDDAWHEQWAFASKRYERTLAELARVYAVSAARYRACLV